MRKLIWLSLILGLSCYGFPQEKKITLQGSTTVFPIGQRCAEEFAKLHPEINISVMGGGSGVGIASLIDKVCDIAMSSRSMKEKEIEKAIEKGVDPKAHLVAMDAIAVIVHPENPIDSLTLSQLKDIYLGKIKNWKEVGGRNEGIVVVSRDTASGTFEIFNEMVLKKKRQRKDALMQASNAAVLSVVKKSKGAIGYVGLGFVEGVKILKIDGIEPSKKTVLDGSYPISRPLFFYTDGDPKGGVKLFIDFVKSKEGQKIVEEQGFVPLN